MLEMGVFGGSYFSGKIKEYPKSWFKNAKLSKNFDVNLDCITISKKQFNYAKERMHKNGLNEKVNIKMEDYRDVQNKYNSIASIEMIEAVGQNYLKNYFESINSTFRIFIWIFS